MADSPIGEIPVSITGDFSQLQQALQAATTAAQQFADSLSGQFTHAKESADELDTSLHGIATELVEFGEALKITEGLKEFADEALHAFATTQQAEISLEALTGSAQVADETIAQLKETALQLPVAFENLVGATQKMVALGFSIDETKDALLAAANASAATGNSFDATANAIDRVALSGQASGRILATLGLSTKDLATEMGIAEPQVTKVFKALDQADRLTLLTAAMQKFGDVAQKEAEGLAGQWQILQNRWELLMDSIGEALSPLATELLKIANTDILPFLQSLVEDFEKLSPQMQDVAIAAAVAAGSIAPLAVAVGALGLSVAAIEGGITALGNLIAIFGEIGAAAPEIEATAVATESAGSAALGLSASFAALSTAAAGLAAGLALFKLDGIINEFEQLWQNSKNLYDEFQPLIQSAKDVASSFVDLLAKVTPLKTAWDTLVTDFSNTSWSGLIRYAIDGMFPGLAGLRTALQEVNAELEVITGKAPDFATAWQRIVDQERETTTVTGQLSAALNNLPVVAQDAAKQFDAMRGPMQGATQDVLAMARAHAQAAAALLDHTKAWRDFKAMDIPTYEETIANSLGKVQEAQLKANSQFQILVETYRQAAAAGLNTDATFKELEKDAKTLGTSTAELLGSMGQLPVTLGNVLNPMEQLIADYADAAEGAVTFGEVGRNAADPVIDAMQKIQAQADAAQQKFDQLVLVYQRMQDSGTASAAAVEQALKDLTDAARALGLTLNDVFTSLEKVSGDLSNMPLLTDNERKSIDDMRMSIISTKDETAKFDQQINQVFERDLSKALGDAIFGTGKLSDAFKKLGQDVVDVVLNEIIKKALQPLLDSLDQVMNKVIGIFGGGTSGGGVLGTTVGAGGGAASTIGGGASSAASGAASGLTGILTTAFTGVSAVTGIIGDIQNAHQTDILKSIELNTRLTATFIGGLGTGGLQDWAKIIADNTTGGNEFFAGGGWFHDSIVSLISTIEDIDALMKRAVPGGQSAALVTSSQAPLSPSAVTSGPVMLNATFHVHGANNPRQVTDQIATYLKTLSPRFAV